MTAPSGWVTRKTYSAIQVRKHSGSVSSTVKEAYLRDDISCGSKACTQCHLVSPSLPLPGDSLYYIIPDADTLRDCLDCLEVPELTDGLIVLTSAVRNRTTDANVRRVARLRALYRDRRSSCVLFDDIHHCDTAPGGDPLVVADWYSHHLTCGSGHVAQSVTIVVVSDLLSTREARQSKNEDNSSPDHQPKQTESFNNLPPGVHVLSQQQYFAGRWSGVPAIIDVFDSLTAAKEAKIDDATASSDSGGRGGGASHWTLAAIHHGLARGIVVTGTLWVNPRDPTMATIEPLHSATTIVTELEGASRVVVHGRSAMNRAVHGDVVAVHLLPQKEKMNTIESLHLETAHETDMDTEFMEEEPADDDAVGAAVSSADICAMNDKDFVGDGESKSACTVLPDGRGDGINAHQLPIVPEISFGEVVAVMQRSGAEIVACISHADESALERLKVQESLCASTQSVLCVPSDRRFPPRIRLRSRQLSRLLGQRFVLRIDGWDEGSNYPHAHVLRVLGSVGDLQAETDAVLVKNGVDIWNHPFTVAALLELPACIASQAQKENPKIAAEWSLSDQEVQAELAAGRRDLRGDEYFIVSIDPPGCTDVDDAMHARIVPPLPNQNCDEADPTSAVLEVGVHIADVSYFVKEGSALDAEASARCTTVYLVDRRLDMLPAVLSEDAASLRAGRDRLAVSVMWKLRLDELLAGRITLASSASGGYSNSSVWFGRTLIKSRRQLEYLQAQEVLEGRGASLPASQRLPEAEISRLEPTLHMLRAVADALRAKRLENGAVELESVEFKFDIGGTVGGAPKAVAVKTEIHMMRIVAELMIFANAAVADRIYASMPRAALLRRHDPPRREGMEEVLALCARSTEPPPSLPTVTDDSVASVDHNNSNNDNNNNNNTKNGDSTFMPLRSGGWSGLGPALRAACADTSPEIATLIKATATRAMSEAQYCCAGETRTVHQGKVMVQAATGQGNSLGHFGLALPLYTHFTSPIRRYADIVVHRQLLAVVAMLTTCPDDARTAPHTIKNYSASISAANNEKKDRSGCCSCADVAEKAAVMNERHRTAKRAQKSCANLYLLLVLHKTPHAERAVVYDISTDGKSLLVFVPKYHTKAMIHLTDKNGIVRPPLCHSESDTDDDDVDASSTRRRLPLHLAIEQNKQQQIVSKVRILDGASGCSEGVREIASFARMDLLWVKMGADVSRAHGPVLRMRLLEARHPLVAQLQMLQKGESIEEEAEEEQSNIRTQRILGISSAISKPVSCHPPTFERPGKNLSLNAQSSLHSGDSIRETQSLYKKDSGDDGKLENVSSALATLALTAGAKSVYSSTERIRVSEGKEEFEDFGQQANNIAEGNVIRAAISRLRAKAAKLAVAAASRHPRDQRALLWAEKAEIYRLQSQKLVEYIDQVS